MNQMLQDPQVQTSQAETAETTKPPVEQFILPFDLTQDESLIITLLRENKTPLAIDDLSID